MPGFDRAGEPIRPDQGVSCGQLKGEAQPWERHPRAQSGLNQGHHMSRGTDNGCCGVEAVFLTSDTMTSTMAGIGGLAIAQVFDDRASRAAGGMAIPGDKRIDEVPCHEPGCMRRPEGVRIPGDGIFHQAVHIVGNVPAIRRRDHGRRPGA